MKIFLCSEESGVAAEIAEAVCTEIRQNPELCLCLPGDIHNAPWFFLFVQKIRTCLARDGTSFRQAKFFATHDHLGVPFAHPASHAGCLWRDFCKPLGFTARNVHLIDGSALDPELECQEYEARIRSAGGIDLLIVVLGTRGEVAGNEPTSSLASRCRVKVLHPDALRDDKRFPPDSRPKRTLTLGIGNLMEARQVIIAATGFNHASAVSRALDGPVSSATVASVFQNHPACTVIVSRAAAYYSSACRRATFKG